MANTPNIRFKGFNDDWEQRKLGELAELVGGGTPSTSKSEYWDGDIDWYAPAEISDKIFVDESQRKISEKGFNSSSAKMLPVGTVLFTSRAGIGKTAILAKEGCTNQGFQSIVPHKDKLDSYFIFSRTEELKKYAETVGAGSTFVEVSGKQMSNMDLMMPPTIKEQGIIGEHFKNLDHFITLHQRKCDEMKQLKKFMLQKMFPKSGELIPEIRFEGFTGDWKPRKFGTMFKRRMERNNGQFDNTQWISVAKMYFQEPDKVTSNNIDTRTYVMRRGDIAFEGHSNAEYKYGRFVANDIGDGIISELFPIYMHIDDYDEAYWKYAIQIEEIMASKLLKCIEISYTSSNKLDEDFFLKEEILVPSLAEQQQIGKFFRDLDHLITLHQRKCDQLKEVKHFMLQNMFPQKG